MNEPTNAPDASNEPRVQSGQIGLVDVRDPDDTAPCPPGDFPAGNLRTIAINVSLLDENDRRAAANRAHFKQLGLRVLNLVSSPGAGKTTLLARTLAALAPTTGCAVMVGDLETVNDAERLRHFAAPVLQITTGSACHLDASMVGRGLERLDVSQARLLFIENVGNLVCPASFDLGETVRVVLFSCTEGEDKPLKYPPIFKSAHVVVLTKTDLAAPAGFDRAVALDHVRRVAPQARVFELSSRTGEGLEGWLNFLRTLL